MAHVYPIHDGVYDDDERMVDAFDPWREAEREFDRPEVERPGVRLIDGEPHYSAAWLDGGEC